MHLSKVDIFVNSRSAQLSKFSEKHDLNHLFVTARQLLPKYYTSPQPPLLSYCNTFYPYHISVARARHPQSLSANKQRILNKQSSKYLQIFDTMTV